MAASVASNCNAAYLANSDKPVRIDDYVVYVVIKLFFAKFLVKGYLCRKPGKEISSLGMVIGPSLHQCSLIGRTPLHSTVKNE